MVESSQSKAHEFELFAKKLAARLESARIARLYGELIVSAPPHFRGVLKKEFTSSVSNMLSCYIDKDYTCDDGNQLLLHLDEYL